MVWSSRRLLCCCPQQVCFLPHIFTLDLSTSTHEQQTPQSGVQGPLLAAMEAVSVFLEDLLPHPASLEANRLLQMWLFLDGPRFRDGFDLTIDSQGEKCLYCPRKSLSSLCLSTSTDIVDTYACPFLPPFLTQCLLFARQDISKRCSF